MADISSILAGTLNPMASLKAYRVVDRICIGRL
jgi:hypothetical protein